MYHISINGAQHGPVSEADLRERLARGELKPTDLCWQSGWPQWRRVSEVFPGPQTPPIADMVPPLPGRTGPPPPTPGLAIISLVLGIAGLVLFPIAFLFAIPAVICGHVAHNRIHRSAGGLGGAGLALGGLITGYIGLVMMPITVGLLAAMAIPAFNKVRINAQQTAMHNDARQIATAAQQYFMEENVTVVSFTYNAHTGVVGGPLSRYVKTIAKGYTATPPRLTTTDDFQLQRAGTGQSFTYSPEGQRR